MTLSYRSKVVSCLILAGAAALALAAAFGPHVCGIRVEFILFAFTLLGVATLHAHTLGVALTGLATVTAYKVFFSSFHEGTGFLGLAFHMEHEWVMLANLLCLLTGFALLSRHFEKSCVAELLPNYLPNDWKGGFVLLVMVFLLSGFLDNIAAALIGAALANQLFQGKVHIGYLAGIVAASNAGGAGSVVGDTTTTMMWIDGVNPLNVLHAYVAAAAALLFCGYFAARQQDNYSPIMKEDPKDLKVDWTRVGIVGLILVFAIGTNMTVNLRFSEYSDSFPFIGAAVWAALLVTIPVRRHDWEIMPETVRGSIFLLSLVTIASMMPVEELPAASWTSALALGFVSSIFDNIPLTKLALDQGGYDWGVLAYCVGFGGSMIWFGSSAGVALSSKFPEARSTGSWLKGGWHVVGAYVLGFAAVLFIMGWHPHAPHKAAKGEAAPVVETVPAESPAQAPAE